MTSFILLLLEDPCPWHVTKRCSARVRTGELWPGNTTPSRGERDAEGGCSMKDGYVHEERERREGRRKVICLSRREKIRPEETKGIANCHANCWASGVQGCLLSLINAEMMCCIMFFFFF